MEPGCESMPTHLARAASIVLAEVPCTAASPRAMTETPNVLPNVEKRPPLHRRRIASDMPGKSTVLYYFQGRAGESSSRPNATYVPYAGAQPTLADLQKYFRSLREGCYHIRARVKESKSYVWVDLCHPNDVVPGAGGTIFLKVLQLGL